jgi:hypothetical protein
LHAAVTVVGLAALATVGILAPSAGATAPEGTHAASGATASHGTGGQGPDMAVPRAFRNSVSPNVLSPSITRSEVIARAKSWVNKGLDYNQNGSYQGYRTDCSGYASMAWNLSTSLATPEFIPDGVATSITKADLKPGDALLNPASGDNGHIALFAGWSTSAHDEYWSYEFTGRGVSYHKIPYPYYSGHGTFSPVRLKNIQDDTVSPVDNRRDVATRVHGDFNGDGRDDVVAFYGYANGSVALHTFKGLAGGGFADPVESWNPAPGQWTYENASFVAGDYNGDGRSDLAAFYGYANGTSAMFTFISNPDGTFGDPVKGWMADAGQWYRDHVQFASGDFDGDGRDEVAALYGYADGSAATFTFKTDPATNKFTTPTKSWNVGKNQWWGTSTQIVSGDFNGDDKDDLAAFYGYADGRASMFTFGSDGNAGFTNPTESWHVPAGSWYGGNVQVAAGDFNHDGITDVSATYSYNTGKVSLFTFLANNQGQFADPTESWHADPGLWYTDHAQFVGGDFNGDGKDELAAFYGYADGRATMFTFNTTTGGGFQPPTPSWNVPEGQWWGDHVKLA